MTFFVKLLPLFFMLLISGCVSEPATKAQWLAHPDDKTARIEYFVERPNMSGRRPVIVLLHGHQMGASTDGGLAFAKWGELKRYSKMGYLAVSVSLPGYGNSTGPRDFAGPRTQNAIRAVLKKLEASGWADPEKIVIQGTSLGAVTASILAAKDREIAGVVLISGLYDLPAFLTRPKSAAAISIKAAMTQQIGGSVEAMEERSVLLTKNPLDLHALILAGAKDDRTDPAQAVSLAQRINKDGGKAVAKIYPKHGHAIPIKARQAAIDAFIQSRLE
jgi:dipeptidyl aminopeptidase/acylaminoacyl peptidase